MPVLRSHAPQADGALASPVPLAQLAWAAELLRSQELLRRPRPRLRSGRRQRGGHGGSSSDDDSNDDGGEEEEEDGGALGGGGGGAGGAGGGLLGGLALGSDSEDDLSAHLEDAEQVRRRVCMECVRAC